MIRIRQLDRLQWLPHRTANDTVWLQGLRPHREVGKAISCHYVFLTRS